MPYLVLRILNSIFADELQLDQLQEFVRIGNPIKYSAEICQCFVVADAR
jgi:hypothetical protein